MNTRRGSASQADTQSQAVQCGSCKKTVRDNQKSLQCGLCERWFHAPCQDVSDAAYDVLSKDSNAAQPQIHWYCNSSCNLLAAKFIGNISKLQFDVGKLSDTVSAMSDRVKQIEEGNFPPAMENALKNLQQDNQAQNAETMQKEEVVRLVDTKAKEHAAEAEDRAKRQVNLMIFRLPESTANSIEEKKEEDEKRVKQILQDIKSKSEPVDIRRLRGPKQANADQGSKNRPIRVSLQSQAARDEVLRAFNKARREGKPDEEGEDGRLFATVSLRKDMTPQERKQEEELFKELKQKQNESKASGDDNAHWVRRQGQVVNVGKYALRQPDQEHPA